MGSMYQNGTLYYPKDDGECRCIVCDDFQRITFQKIRAEWQKEKKNYKSPESYNFKPLNLERAKKLAEETVAPLEKEIRTESGVKQYHNKWAEQKVEELTSSKSEETLNEKDKLYLFSELFKTSLCPYLQSSVRKAYDDTN